MPDTYLYSTTEAFWDAFDLDDELLEPEPEPGDFWGEPNDDCPSGD
jgi:hypothetical protein